MSFLKKELLGLFSLIILISSCTGNSRQGTGSAQEPIGSKDNELIDFASKGMENLNASRHMKDILCQCWDNKEDAVYAKGLDASNIEVVYRGYCLFSDGTMVKDPRGVMETGKWWLDDKGKPVTVNFLLNNGQTGIHQLAYLAPYNMKLVHTEDGKKQVEDLGSEALRYIDPTKDPFHISHNRWRLKPGKPESFEQIKQRLKDCIHFFILFYDKKIDAHSEEISFIGLPSCFKWYGGAIYLQKKNELQSKWVNTFYNSEQAMEAYKIADKLISQKYKWPKEGNWLMQNVAVLRQMEGKIDSL